jgi:hypothetical protein
MRKLFVLIGLIALFAMADSRPPDIPFRIEMVDPGASETAAVADINHDGRSDIVSGEYWYEAPAWKPHKFRDLNYMGGYIDNFADLPIDVNGDGYPDIVSVSWFGKKISWWQNPGKKAGPWVEHPIDSGYPIEFAFLVDLTNSGKKQDIIPQWGSTNAPLTWYEPKDGGFVRHVVSDHSYGHGIGVGDVNGDGRNDIITPKGWFEAPSDPRTGEWKFHPDWDATAGVGFCGLQAAAPQGRGRNANSSNQSSEIEQAAASPTRGDLAFMYAVNINGDGRNDILTSCAHDYGIFWLEQGENDQWTKHNIDYSFSQAHSSALADLRGDGHLDFVVAKRYMAHNGNDPGAREPLGVYWYEYRKTAQGSVGWIRHLIDYDGRMGGGVEMQVVDLDGDGDLDVVTGGKSGLFIARNLTKNPATHLHSAAARPKPESPK